MSRTFYINRKQEIRSSFLLPLSDDDLFDTIDSNPEQSGAQDTGYKVISAQWDIPYPMMSTADGILASGSFFTSSTQNDKGYFLNVYAQNPQSVASASVEFSVAYAQMSGSGSIDASANPATRAIYNQYKNMIGSYETADPVTGVNKVAFTDVFESDSTRSRFGGVFVSVNRELLRESVDPLNFRLKVGNKLYYVVTSSVDNTLNQATGKPNRSDVYYLSSSTSAKAGLLVPKLGIAGVSLVDVPSLTGSLTEDYALGFVDACYKKMNEVGGWALQSSNQRIYFLRVKYDKFNFTTNNTNTLDSANARVQSTSYITTVGLFDTEGNLVATAKLSHPLKKTPTEEYLLKIQLTY